MSQGVEVSLVSRGDSTLRGHFPSDLVSLEEGIGGERWRSLNSVVLICLLFCFFHMDEGSNYCSRKSAYGEGSNPSEARPMTPSVDSCCPRHTLSTAIAHRTSELKNSELCFYALPTCLLDKPSLLRRSLSGHHLRRYLHHRHVRHH